jgi:4'-phosphopantetheinyl transferase
MTIGHIPTEFGEDEGTDVEPLPLGEVHVWTASLEQPAETVARLRALLNDDERARADRFLFEKGRTQFTVGRGVLRLLVGRYLGVRPEEVRFAYNAYGKPMLGGVGPEASLRFNLSHSGSLVLYALAQGREVGIDVETIRPDFAADNIAQRFFAPAEVAALRALPEAARTTGFFTCWTRKEAFIKARGKGLSIPLDAFEVSLAPGARAEVLVTHDDPDEAGRWTLHDLQPGPGYAGALAVAGEGCRPRHRTWTGLGLEP